MQTATPDSYSHRVGIPIHIRSESLSTSSGIHTHTHGFTEHVFALSYLLGYSFMPRLRDLADQHLNNVDRSTDYGCLNPLFRGVVDTDLIREQWDALVRIAASLKNRTAPANIIIQRLQNSPS